MKTSNPSRLITGPLRATRALDAALTFVLDRERIDRMARRLVVCGPHDDARLLRFTHPLNEIAGDVAIMDSMEDTVEIGLDGNLRFDLAELAAYALLWATTGQKTLVRGVKAIVAERARQRELLAAGRIVDDCSHPDTANAAKFRVLMEECGEVAHAIDQVNHHGLAATNIYTELFQVAAVCVAWLESLEPRKGAKR